MDRSGWETEKKSWSEERRRAEGPPFGDILERSGREEQRVREERRKADAEVGDILERFGREKQKEVEEERSVSLGGWKPLSEGWATTPDIWTNEVL